MTEGLFGRQREDVFERAAGRFSLDALARDGFAWQTALNAVLCSHVAYRSADAASRFARNRWNFDTCQPIAASDTEGFVASTSDAIVVAFRGTQQTADWLINLNVSWTRAPYGDVHRGFHDAFQSVRTQLEDALADARASEKQVLITGHSLGGALATIAAAEWHGQYPIAGIYTFGQPAVGFTALRSYIAVRYRHSFHRFVNDDDIVARVPPGYRHVGKLYHFTGGNVRHETLSAVPGRTAAPVAAANDTPTMTQPEFQQLKAQLEAARTVAPAAVNESLHSNVVQEGFFPSVSDHSLDRYVGKIFERA
ncbi:lipase family protein [Maioricimonas rarisocia]|uniref:lipase family protein n=1 Tax=Maioricimonas rarisocia TaxID=2528026 RepID=UPI0018D1F9C9|nr:lipase family protein [Maioricimonas rarisocia]